MRSSFIFSVLLLATLMTACGQKGPLYFPQDTNAANNTDTAQQTDAASTASNSDTNNETDNDTVDSNPADLDKGDN